MKSRENLKILKKMTAFLMIGLSMITMFYNNNLIISAKEEQSKVNSDFVEKNFNGIDLSKLYLTFSDLEIIATTENPEDYVNAIINVGTVNYDLREDSNPFVVMPHSQDGKYNVFGKELTEDEIWILVTHPWYIQDFIDCVDIATVMTNQRYGAASDGSIPNAFLHAYWNVLMVKKVGQNLARDFATAHENYVGNPEIHKYMDLHNNEKGRIIASNISDLSSRSNDYLADVVVNAVDNGQLYYILFNFKYVHTLIYYDTHTEVIYAYGSFYAYTNKVTPANPPQPILIDYRTNPGPTPVPYGGGNIHVE